MLEAHLPLVITLILAAGLGGLILTLGYLLGPKRPSAIKHEPFECGNPTSGTARDRFNVKYFLVAILFLVFDLEAVFIYPWAVVFSDSVKGKSDVSPLPLFGALVFFLLVLVVGLVYEWRKGGLDWSRST